MRKCIFYISVIYLLFSHKSYAQDRPEHSGFSIEPSRSSWSVSDFFSSEKKYTYALALPFNYPFEARLHPDTIDSLQNLFEQKNNLALFSGISFAKEVTNIPMTVTGNHFNLITYASEIQLEPTHYERDTNTRLPSPWNNSSQMINKTRGIVFAYMHRNISLNMELAMRFAGNEVGQAVFESALSNVGLNYKVNNSTMNKLASNLNLNVQLQSVQLSDERFLPRKNEPIKSKQSFLSSGFTLNTKSWMLEGMIRMPITPAGQATTVDFDGSVKPEIQGRLGMKWYLPEFIKP